MPITECMAEEETNTGSPGQPDANAATAGANGGLASLARDIDNLMSTPKTPQQPEQPADDGGDQVGLLLKEINDKKRATHYDGASKADALSRASP